MNTKRKGDIAVAKVMTALVERGLDVLVPMSEACRYDLAVDDGETIHRIQCKLARQERDISIVFNTRSTHSNGENGEIVSRDYRGDIDAFGVYWSEGDEVYIVPIEETGSSTTSLRVEDSPFTNDEEIKYATNYQLTEWPPLAGVA